MQNIVNSPSKHMDLISKQEADIHETTSEHAQKADEKQPMENCN